MKLLPLSKRRDFTLRSRRKREQADRRPLRFRRPQRRNPARGANLLWLIALLIVVVFLLRYFRSLSW